MNRVAGMGCAFVVTAIAGGIASCGQVDEAEVEAGSIADTEVASSLGDPDTGRRLFVSKSCVVCHSVQTVGGRVAPALDAVPGMPQQSELDFIAGIWRGAPIMLELQRLEIGYQINMTGEELGHLAAFGTDPEAQERFSIEDVPEEMRDLFLNEISMEMDLEDRYEGEEWVDIPDAP